MNLGIKVNQLRDELAEVIVEKDEMLGIYYKELIRLYAEKIGQYEDYLHEREYTYLRLKRKLEMIEYEKKKSLDIDLYTIDQRLDADYEDFEVRIRTRKKLTEKSLGGGGLDFNGKHYAKLRQYYKDVVRAIHPLIFPDLSPEDRRTWTMAYKAYEDLDLQKMEAYSIGLAYMDQDYEDYVKGEDSYLEEQIHEKKKYMASMERLHPFNKREILADEERIGQERARINKRIREVDEKISQTENKILFALSS